LPGEPLPSTAPAGVPGPACWTWP